jgi:hypothetical protein
MKPKSNAAITVRSGGMRSYEIALYNQTWKPPKPKSHTKTKLLKANGTERPVRKTYTKTGTKRYDRKNATALKPLAHSTPAVDETAVRETIRKWIRLERAPVENPWSNADRISGRKLAHAIRTARATPDLY